MKIFYFLGLFLLSIISYAQDFSQYKRIFSTYAGPEGTIPVDTKTLSNQNLLIIGSIGTKKTNLSIPYLNSFTVPTDPNFTYNIRNTNPLNIEDTTYNYYFTELTPTGERIKSGYLNLDFYSSNIANPNLFIGQFNSDYSYQILHQLPTNLTLNNQVDLHSTIYVDEAFNIYIQGSVSAPIAQFNSSTSFINEFRTRQIIYEYDDEVENIQNGVFYKMNLQGEFLWGTYLDIYAIADFTIGNDEVYILANYSTNDLSTIPQNIGVTQPNSFQTTATKNFFLRLNATNGNYIYSTYFGNNNILYNYVTYNNGSLYFASRLTAVFNDSRLISTDAYQTTPFNRSSSYLGKFDLNFTPIWGTYISGNRSTAIDQVMNRNRKINILNDKIYISGTTMATQNLITGESIEQHYGGGFNDNFIMKFTTNGQFIYGSYFGGINSEQHPYIQPISEDTYYLIGTTSSDKGISTTNAYQFQFSLHPINTENSTPTNMYFGKFGPESLLNTSDLITSNIKIYPNPSHNKQLSIDGYLAKGSSIEMYNLIGQKVFEQKTHPINKHFIHFPSVTSGTYLIKVISSKNEIITQKIIVK